MNRKDITKFLSDLLEKDRLSGAGKYWAKEVTFDYGKENSVRVDYVQFKPLNQLAVDGLEKGEFICYEIKSCKEDYLSGHGLNYEGEKNYLVMTMGTFKALKECGEIDKLPYCVGILVPMPYRKKYKEDKIQSEYEHPTEFLTTDRVYLETIKPAKKTYRKRPMTEMLFCMLRTFHK